MDIRSSLRKFPFIAILRGIKTSEAFEAGLILKNADFEIIEVPLNSPTPFNSIRTLAESFGKASLVEIINGIQSSRKVDRSDDNSVFLSR